MTMEILIAPSFAPLRASISFISRSNEILKTALMIIMEEITPITPSG